MNWEIIDTISFFSFAWVFYFLSVLSRRLGEVLGMKKYYYLYYLSTVFALMGSVIMTSLTGIENLELFGYALFSLSLTIGLIVSIKYWGWLFKEIIKG